MRPGQGGKKGERDARARSRIVPYGLTTGIKISDSEARRGGFYDFTNSSDIGAHSFGADGRKSRVRAKDFAKHARA